ncbi:MAG: hypothetical protein PHD49_02925 [Candidatus Shapirobacteria bacterium]|nr:hypothetical protein [Candidatus Shapirobacteria bacterium]
MDNPTNDQKFLKQTSTIPNPIIPETSTATIPDPQIPVTAENPVSTMTEVPVVETELPPIQPQSEPEIEKTESTGEYQNEYQDILNQYAANQEITPPLAPVQKNENPPPTPTITDSDIFPIPPQNNLFKIIFIISLIIFVLTSTVLAFVYFKNQKSSPTINNQPSTIDNLTPTAPSGTCFLNDKTYQTGETFTATDGCNTCTCVSQNNISCTDKECPSLKSATESATNSTKTATSSSIPKDWQAYTDSVYKYSIQYPLNWTIDKKITSDTRLLINSPEKIKSLQNPNNYEGYSGDDINIQVYEDYKNSLTKNQSLEEYFKSSGLFSNVKKIKIGNTNGYIVDEAGMDTTPAYFIINSNNVFKITSFLSFSQTELKILDSFKIN